MRIFYINSSGAGFADHIDVPEGTTLGQLFGSKMPGCDPGDYLIRLNRAPAASNEVLCEGCRVSITPSKIEGARTFIQESARERFLRPAGHAG